jgi:hypothetical protein
MRHASHTRPGPSVRMPAAACLPLLATCLAAVAVTAGCSRPPAAPEAVMRIEDVPPELMKIAQQELPGVRFDSVWRKPSGTLEIRGREKNGKVREVEVRPDGSIQEVE